MTRELDSYLHKENKEKEQKTIFLISPVRNISQEEKKLIGEYVAKLEASGNVVYWPIRDNPLEQTDKISLDICRENMRAIKKANEVHIWFSPGSEGSRIDIGISLAFDKKVVLANPEMIQPTENKSFNNLLLALAKEKH